MHTLPVELLQLITRFIDHDDYYNLYFSYQSNIPLPPVLSLTAFNNFIKTKRYYRIRIGKLKHIGLPVLDKEYYCPEIFSYLLGLNCLEAAKMFHLISNSELLELLSRYFFYERSILAWPLYKYLNQQNIAIPGNILGNIYRNAANNNCTEILMEMVDLVSIWEKRTVFHSVCYSSAFEVFEYLLQHLEITRGRFSDILRCALNRDMRFIKKFLETCQGNVDSGTLRYTIQHVDKSCAKLLFSYPNTRKTLLDCDNNHLLTGSGKIQYVFIWDYLLENLGDPASSQNEAIFVACKENAWYLVSKLLEDPRVNPYDRNCSIFTNLCGRKQFRIFKMLYKPNLTFDFKSILLELITRNSQNTIKFLLDNNEIKLADFEPVHIKALLKSGNGTLKEQLLNIPQLLPLFEQQILEPYQIGKAQNWHTIKLSQRHFWVLVPLLDQRFNEFFDWAISEEIVTDKKLISIIIIK
ncbi:hypothetical protein HK103_006568 [Boothiomyces macroporosus]|uniref:Uncharacterized protein n=1 Tax=Boothiomyces macroporosus TaxID=261099 RepID=A0AAD5UE01_9FUNG|nr:hypothetical protein HK103_006568 [Boothiomyces macroporosus]